MGLLYSEEASAMKQCLQERLAQFTKKSELQSMEDLFYFKAIS